VDGANFRRTLFIVQNKPAKLDLKRREITTGVWALPCMIAEEEGLLAVIPKGGCVNQSPASSLRSYFCLHPALTQTKRLVRPDTNKKPRLRRGLALLIAEEEGFEPPEPYSSTVFKTAAFDRSATPLITLEAFKPCRSR
jgi:hypothetical protein